jgi:tetratricopeptide (TPR) repeat protein
MKKPDSTLQDIYQASPAPPEERSSPTARETIARDIRRHQIFSGLIGSLTLGLIVLLVFLLTRAYLPEKSVAPPGIKPPSYIATYTLPADELWAVEYRPAAEQQDSEEPPGPKPFSTKWMKNTGYHCIMGDQAFRHGNWATAQAHFERALEAFPDLLGVRRALGATYLKQQLFQPAVDQLQLALKENPSVDVLNNLGAAYIGTGQYDLAEPLLKQVLRQSPDSTECYRNLALLYRNAGRTNDAFSAFETYLTRVPQKTDLLESYTDYQVQAGRLDEAIEFLEQLKGADPVTVQLLLAKTAARKNDADRTVQALDRAAAYISPRQLIAIMHEAVFDGVAQTDSFKALKYKLEMATVSPEPYA